MSDQDFDALFQQAADQYDTPFDPEAWAKMQDKLDRAAGPSDTPDTTGGGVGTSTGGAIRYLIGLLLIAGLIGMGWWYFTPPPPRSGNASSGDIPAVSDGVPPNEMLPSETLPPEAYPSVDPGETSPGETSPDQTSDAEGTNLNRPSAAPPDSAASLSNASPGNTAAASSKTLPPETSSPVALSQTSDSNEPRRARSATPPAGSETKGAASSLGDISSSETSPGETSAPVASDAAKRSAATPAGPRSPSGVPPSGVLPSGPPASQQRTLRSAAPPVQARGGAGARRPPARPRILIDASGNVVPDQPASSSLSPLAGEGVELSTTAVMPQRSVDTLALRETTEVVPMPDRASPRWRLSVGVSPDISAVDLGEAQQVGSKVFLGLEYFVRPRLSVSAGAIFSHKVYSAAGEAYQPAPDYWNDYPVPNTVDARCNVLDIPLNVRYYAVNRPRTRAFLSGGASSYLMLTEDYAYRYQDNRRPPREVEQRVRNANQHYFGVANVSVGYERALGRRWAIQAEPFVKMPLTGVGFGKVKLLTTGVFFSLQYQLR